VADDGDPLDALVLMDEPAFCGCLIESRLVGVIEAEQSEDGQTERNDRLIARGKKFRPLGRFGPKRAARLVRKEKRRIKRRK
jgi:inorganic pyrophosphatase